MRVIIVDYIIMLELLILILQQENYGPKLHYQLEQQRLLVEIQILVVAYDVVVFYKQEIK
jgi:hypothetical protein